MDNGFFRTLGKLADLMILNILFIVCSIPIFTIGASLTAMYYVTLKMAEMKMATSPVPSSNRSARTSSRRP